MQVRGLVKQHVDSFNHLVDIEIKQIVKVRLRDRVRSKQIVKVRLRVRVRSPSPNPNRNASPSPSPSPSPNPSPNPNPNAQLASAQALRREGADAARGGNASQYAAYEDAFNLKWRGMHCDGPRDALRKFTAYLDALEARFPMG